MTSTDSSINTLPLELRKLQRRFLTTPKVCADSINKSNDANYNLPADLVQDTKNKIEQANEYLKSSNTTKEQRAAVQSKLVDIKAHLKSTQKREVHGLSPSKVANGKGKPVLLRKQSTSDSISSQTSIASDMSPVSAMEFHRENSMNFLVSSFKEAVGIKASQDITAAFQAYSK